MHYLKATDESSTDETGAPRIVGLSGWQEPKNRRARDAEPQDELPGPSKWNSDFRTQYEKTLVGVEKSVLGQSEDLWYVRMATILPAWHRLGIAQQLVKRGIELMDEAGEGVYLEATPAATKLYERNGFERAGELEIPEGYRAPIMLRKSSR